MNDVAFNAVSGERLAQGLVNEYATDFETEKVAKIAKLFRDTTEFTWAKAPPL